MTQFRPQRFQAIPPVIKNLIIINVLVFIAQNTFQNVSSFNIENFFALHAVQSGFFRPHQLVTYMFLHGGFGHIFFNMFALWMFGATLENFWGSKRFLVFYLACGIGAGLLHLFILWRELAPFMDQFHQLPIEQQQEYLYNPNTSVGDVALNGATLGASGAVFGCLAAFGYLFPNTEMLILPIPFPIKAKWFVLLYAGMELYLGIQNSAGDNVAHWAHLGGAIVGIIMVLYWKKTDRRNFY